MAVVNYAAGAIAGAQIPPQGGIGPPQNVGIKTIFSGKSPPASAPGTPPGVRTGMLRNSIGITLATKRKGTKSVTAIAGTDAKYARALDLARDQKRRRPFMMAGIRSAENSIEGRIARIPKRLGAALRKRVKRLPK